MLYTESMEMASPLLVREASVPTTEKITLVETMKNRMAKPRVDLGLCMGSEAFLVCTPKGQVCYPARVATRQHNQRVVALGQDALELEGREPEGIVVTRPIVDGVVVDPNLASKLMSRVIAASKHGLVSPPRVALAVPAGMTAVESQSLLATAKRAGARSVYLVDQAMAAAIGAGRDLTKPEGHLVVHAGAGVTQVTVSSLASPVISRSTRVAGDQMTEALRDYIRREHNLLVDDKVAASVKHELGSALEPVIERDMKIVGRELGIGKPVEKTITAREVYGVLKPFLQDIAQLARWVVGEMPAELLCDVHRNGVLLSGGTAELSRLDEFLAEQLRLKVVVPSEPQNLVAKGLQRLLNDLSLRKAVFGQGKTSPKQATVSESKGTGLVGLLIVTAGLAMAANSAPFLQHGAASTLDQYLGSVVTPSAPLAEGWGWHQPDAAVTTDLQDRRRSQLERENQRLRKLLKAPKGKPAKTAVLQSTLADVVARDPRGWMSALTLNVGTKDGIAAGMTVSDGINLVGQVTKVQKDRCQVRLFTDSKAVVAGKLEGRKASGVVVGSADHTVEMRYLDPDAGVKKGDWVLTSGHDGVFPAGIRLGRVESIRQPSEKNYLAAVIKPSIDVNNLENVVVIRG